MTCAGTASLILLGSLSVQGREYLEADFARNCGKGPFSPNVARGLKWLDDRLPAGDDFGPGRTSKYHYLYLFERAARLSGRRAFIQADWYRLFAESLLSQQNKESGSWRGADPDTELAAASYAPYVPGQRWRPGPDQQAEPPAARRLEPRPGRRE